MEQEREYIVAKLIAELNAALAAGIYRGPNRANRRKGNK